MDWSKTTARRDKKHLCFGIGCTLYLRTDGSTWSALVSGNCLLPDSTKPSPESPEHHFAGNAQDISPKCLFKITHEDLQLCIQRAHEYKFTCEFGYMWLVILYCVRRFWNDWCQNDVKRPQWVHPNEVHWLRLYWYLQKVINPLDADFLGK